MDNFLFKLPRVIITWFWLKVLLLCKLKSYLHHREYDVDPIDINKIQNLINSKSVIYDHRVDKTEYKFGGGQKLEKIDLEFLPRYISSNKEKYLDWLEK